VIGGQTLHGAAWGKTRSQKKKEKRTGQMNADREEEKTSRRRVTGRTVRGGPKRKNPRQRKGKGGGGGGGGGVLQGGGGGVNQRVGRLQGAHIGEENENSNNVANRPAR